MLEMLWATFELLVKILGAVCIFWIFGFVVWKADSANRIAKAIKENRKDG